MARPKQGYFLDGTRVPGTTTITGRFKDSGALMYWACSQGQKYPNKPTMEALRGEAEEAAEIGTQAHELFEAWLHNEYENVVHEGIHPKAFQAFDNACRWWNQQKGKVVWSEEPLVSPSMRFGGTPDHVIKVGRKLRIMDVKTGGVYMDALLQVAAYGYLVEEVKGQKISGYDIVRFSKDEADFVHRSFEDLSDAWEMFKLLRQAYDLDSKLKKRAK